MGDEQGRLINSPPIDRWDNDEKKFEVRETDDWKSR
jgi:hypothetical protein